MSKFPFFRNFFLCFRIIKKRTRKKNDLIYGKYILLKLININDMITYICHTITAL